MRVRAKRRGRLLQPGFCGCEKSSRPLDLAWREKANLSMHNCLSALVLTLVSARLELELNAVLTYEQKHDATLQSTPTRLSMWREMEALSTNDGWL